MKSLTSRPGYTDASSIAAGAVGAVVLIGLGVAFAMSMQSTPATDTTASSSSSSAPAVMQTTSSSSSSLASNKSQADIDACINAATEAHNKRWADACADKKNTMRLAFNACIEKGQDESYCDAQWGGYADISDRCDLGAARTATLNVTFEVAKSACSK